MKKYVLIFVMLLACFAGLNCGAESKCDASKLLDFKPEHVYLEQGKTVIEGTFYNKGDIGTRVTKAELSVDANDMAGNLLRSASCVFSNVNAWVPAHGNKSWTFIITDSTAQEYSRKFKWNVKINYSYSNDNKPTVTTTTSTPAKPAANSGQPQKPTDNRITINQLDLDGEYEVVEVGTHPDYGDIWAETLGAKVKFFRYSDVYRRDDKDFIEDFAKFFEEENWLVASVISSPSGSTHFTHKENSEVDNDWLLRTTGDFEGGRNRLKYRACKLYRWYEEFNAAENINDGTDWGFSVDGDYVYVWKVTDGGNSGIVSRGRTDMVLKRIK